VSDALSFAKYQGAGNDVVLVLDAEDRRPLGAEQVARICDRRFGVGADGVIRLVGDDVDGARWFMDYRNADGSLAEVCGNGIRCAAAFLLDRALERGPVLRIRTRAGVHDLEVDGEGLGRRIGVSMGRAAFARGQIPMLGPPEATFLGEPVELAGARFLAAAVSIGNPHLVLLTDDDPGGIDLTAIGAALAEDPRFPEGVNVEVARPQGEVLVARVLERGSGETLACGSGACAIAAVAERLGRSPARATVRFPGGDLEVERRAGDELWLRGGAAKVFEGAMELP
jgi:diaminopimelate epimerase